VGHHDEATLLAIPGEERGMLVRPQRYVAPWTSLHALGSNVVSIADAARSKRGDDVAIAQRSLSLLARAKDLLERVERLLWKPLSRVVARDHLERCVVVLDVQVAQQVPDVGLVVKLRA
jgi:hypothetical protein